MKKVLFLFLAFAFFSTSCSTTYLSFKNSPQNMGEVKEVFENGKSQLVSQKNESVVVLSCEKAAVGSREIVALLSVLITQQGKEIVFNPETITAEGNWENGKKNGQIELVVQDPDQYTLKKEKKVQNAAMWANIANGMNSGINQSNMAQAGNQYNVAGVNAYAIKDKQLKEEASKSEQNLAAAKTNIKTSSSEFLRATTLSSNKSNQIGGKVIFYPKTGVVPNFTSIVIRVPVGNDVHKFILKTGSLKI